MLAQDNPQWGFSMNPELLSLCIWYGLHSLPPIPQARLALPRSPMNAPLGYVPFLLRGPVYSRIACRISASVCGSSGRLCLCDKHLDFCVTSGVYLRRNVWPAPASLDILSASCCAMSAASSVCLLSCRKRPSTTCACASSARFLLHGVTLLYRVPLLPCRPARRANTSG